MKTTFCHYDELAGTIAVRFADDFDDAWFVADQYLCSIVDDEDSEILVLVDPYRATEPNDDGEYVFQVRKIQLRQP